MAPLSAPFLPMSMEEVHRLGWDSLDIILISGDAYVDHPSFGTAMIGRWLMHLGWRVGIISQPDWRTTQDFTRLGKPNLFFGITSGNTDSMIANYTANKKLRDGDDYSPGGKAGLRPDHAVIVYTNRVRELYSGAPVIIGGIEASLRRLAHYDYWEEQVRRSILVDSRADILVYGMAERQVAEIAQRLSRGEAVSDLSDIRGTCVVVSTPPDDPEAVQLPSYENTVTDKKDFSRAFLLASRNLSPRSAKVILQPHARQWLKQLPPALPLTTGELNALYKLPFARLPHPAYGKNGGIKAFETVRWSLTANRGCCGECSFCSLTFHQGRIVQSRSPDSLVNEASILAKDPAFRGTITDVGGPTANLYTASCAQWSKHNTCKDKKCLLPQPCVQLQIDYPAMNKTYERLRRVPGVKHVFIGSGLRYDLLVSPKARDYLRQLVRHHISGLLKVAPEHCSNEVLRYMQKPDFSSYENFVEIFRSVCKEESKELYLVNYFITSHPGCTLNDAVKLGLYLAKRGVRPEQIQDFIPSPMTLATCIYYTGHDPATGKPVFTAKTIHERRQQRALVQYANPKNAGLIKEALQEAGMEHLVPKLLAHPGRKRPAGSSPGRPQKPRSGGKRTFVKPWETAQQPHTDRKRPSDTRHATAQQPRSDQKRPSDSRHAAAQQPRTDRKHPSDSRRATAKQPRTSRNRPPETHHAAAPKPRRQKKRR